MGGVYYTKVGVVKGGLIIPLPIITTNVWVWLVGGTKDSSVG